MQYVKKVFPAFMTITLFRRKPVRQHIVLASVVVVKGGSVFLCVGIGIRFLAKPDTQRGTTVAKGALLDWKGILTSLFFGLTIGFGAGFVGSGGGMMMLVVFTAFLGMERRSAVGTSTFIMTFTAPFSAAMELFTHNGDDTVTVPVIIAVVLAVLCVI